MFKLRYCHPANYKQQLNLMLVEMGINRSNDRNFRGVQKRIKNTIYILKLTSSTANLLKARLLNRDDNMLIDTDSKLKWRRVTYDDVALTYRAIERGQFTPLRETSTQRRCEFYRQFPVNTA